MCVKRENKRGPVCCFVCGGRDLAKLMEEAATVSEAAALVRHLKEASEDAIRGALDQIPTRFLVRFTRLAAESIERRCGELREPEPVFTAPCHLMLLTNSSDIVFKLIELLLADGVETVARFLVVNRVFYKYRHDRRYDANWLNLMGARFPNAMVAYIRNDLQVFNLQALDLVNEFWYDDAKQFPKRISGYHALLYAELRKRRAPIGRGRRQQITKRTLKSFHTFFAKICNQQFLPRRIEFRVCLDGYEKQCPLYEGFGFIHTVKLPESKKELVDLVGDDPWVDQDYNPCAYKESPDTKLPAHGGPEWHKIREAMDLMAKSHGFGRVWDSVVTIECLRQSGDSAHTRYFYSEFRWVDGAYQAVAKFLWRKLGTTAFNGLVAAPPKADQSTLATLIKAERIRAARAMLGKKGKKRKR